MCKAHVMRLVCVYIYIYIKNCNYKMDIVKCLTPFLHKNKQEKPFPIVCCYFITWVNITRSYVNLWVQIY